MAFPLDPEEILKMFLPLEFKVKIRLYKTKTGIALTIDPIGEEQKDESKKKD